MDTSTSSSSSDDNVLFIRKTKVYQRRSNYMEKYNELAFFERFRLTKDSVMALLDQIVHVSSLPTNNLLEGTMQRFIGFFRVFDCTLIEIQSPGGDDAEIYRCRKGYFAINVQTVSDANLKIRNIVARWPGSCHDQTVFNNSMLKHECVQGRFNPYLLIGDSGYSLEPYLMTPLQHTETPAENLYNESIIRTRNVVERQLKLLLKTCTMNQSFAREMLWRGNIESGRGDSPF
ncbi:DDE superfamily endonuclease [Popillia japonica]|uniref:DDE superfamily endonuclease n=1 Tax=Popillia japonica TaxID=7064 RepID=A0AAW1L5H2_POPJA